APVLTTLPDLDRRSLHFLGQVKELPVVTPKSILQHYRVVLGYQLVLQQQELHIRDRCLVYMTHLVRELCRGQDLAADREGRRFRRERVKHGVVNRRRIPRLYITAQRDRCSNEGSLIIPQQFV